MSNKPVIVHVIDNLSRGGAETLLVDLLKDLQYHYDIILVTLNSFSEFSEEEIVCKKRYNLEYAGSFSFFKTIRALRKIIRKHKPVLVRSQLYWSTVITRLACPKHIPVVFSVHVTLSDGSFKFTRKGVILKWLEKFTYKKRHTVVGVTQEVIDDYKKTIGIKGAHYVLHNYANNAYAENSVEYNFSGTGKCRMVAVGNPKKQKNYDLLVRTFRLLNDKSVSCDIYGYGAGFNEALQADIDKYNLPVYLKGKSATVYKELKHYDVYIMCSIFEGFGIAVAEAMAAGLPVFLSDLKVLREVSQGNAIFFNPHDEKELAVKINDFKSGKYNAQAMSARGKAIYNANYSKKVYMEKLLKIYAECISR